LWIHSDGIRELLSHSVSRPAAIALAAMLAPLQPAGPPASGGGTQIASPSVVATTFSRLDATGAALELLVLWRGAPGWFLGTDGSRTVTREEAIGGRHDGDRRVLVHLASFGAHVLQLRFDRAARLVNLQGIDVSLGDANVVLVDRVDNPSGPVISGTERVEWKVERLPVPLRPLLRSSPKLHEFLRCDTSLTDPKVQAVVQSVVCGSP